MLKTIAKFINYNCVDDNHSTLHVTECMSYKMIPIKLI